MSKSAPKPADLSGNGPLSAPLALAGTVGGVFAKACTEWQQEVARFTSQRLEGDMELMRSLSECRRMADALQLQQAWASNTLQAYTSESSQLMEIASRVAREGVRNLGSARN